MFAKNKVSQSLVDAVSSIVNEAEKVPTTTGMKVYGSSYGNSQKARKDQLKSTLADVKGPSKSDIEKEKEVKEELKGNQHKIDKNKNNKIDAHDFKLLRKEELKGDQHKIDANKNNKIDAHDFQLLRGKKKVKEDTFADKLFNSLSESEEIRRAINEVMKRDDSAGDWISDFLHSDNPKFDGKSKAERKKMALAAYYSMKKRSRNESVEDLEMTKTSDEAEDTAARKSIKAKDTEKSQKIDNFDSKYGKPNEFGEEVEIDEAAPKKMDDVAKQNLTPAKKGVVGTVKSDFKNFKNFLAGKPETNEAVDSSNQTIDTLAGRSKKVPKEAKIDNAHSSAKVALKVEEVESIDEATYNHKKAMQSQNPRIQKKGIGGAMDNAAKRIQQTIKDVPLNSLEKRYKEEVESLDEDNYLNKFLSSRGINPKFVTRNTKVAHAKSNEYKTWLKNHKDIDGYKMSEASEVPFDGPYTKTKKDVKDKSGAVHTPMSRAKDLAQQAMKRVKSETMMGKAGATSESKKK